MNIFEKKHLFLSTITKIMGCKKLALYPEKTAVIWSIYKSGEHQKNHVNCLDYGARFYDPEIGRFHSVDLLSEVYSFQSPYAYAANDPIQYIDYMGMGPLSWLKKAITKVVSFFNNSIATYSTVHDKIIWHPRVQPPKPQNTTETREVVYTQRYAVTPQIGWEEWGEDDPRWGSMYNHHSSFDYSAFGHVKGQGVLFSDPDFQGRLIVSRDRITRRSTKPIQVANDYGKIRVLHHIRRFMGLAMGNRLHVTFHGRYPDVPVYSVEEQRLLQSSNISNIDIHGTIYYQRVLRLQGTRAYFEELQRAGIIERFE
jgi:RHS repeat-associated protein